MDELEGRIGPVLHKNLTNAYQAIFQYAPNTQLFVTGYPRFWNADTDHCDTVSFKTYCPSNSVLPLIKYRRLEMNRLTGLLNTLIQAVVKNGTFPIGSKGSITYVDVDPFFEGHRFCEEGVKEPGYRNEAVWFYPFEFATNYTLRINGNTDLTNGRGCDGIDARGDQGHYFICLMTKGLRENGLSVDLSTLPNNVPREVDEVDALTTNSLWDVQARIFHPTINGHAAYKQAVLTAYHAKNSVKNSAFLNVHPIGSMHYFSYGTA